MGVYPARGYGRGRRRFKGRIPVYPVTDSNSNHYTYNKKGHSNQYSALPAYQLDFIFV